MATSLKQLRVFVSVAQEKTITGAAAKLFLSKAAVSMALAELEKQLDHQLFDRNNNRLLINEQGKRLLPAADELLSRSHDIEHMFNQKGAVSGKLRIGSSDTVGIQVTPFLLRDFRQHTGHKDQSLFISNTAEICHKLSEFELDIGLVEGHVRQPDLSIHPWLEDEMVIACPPDHPLTQMGVLSFSALEQSEWILREQGSGTRDFFINHVASHLAQWHLVLELNKTEAILNCVAAGMGITCISNYAIAHAVKDGRVAALKLPVERKRQYWLIYHKEKYRSPLMETFIHFSRNWEMPLMDIL
ncbi:LysR family transcriptional regulator [Vibrio sp. HA2012]|uniref:LysR substrate-binding domain-containing protein n=1 Tax=Vibrio sp. HA2012 TaxID=1971595 RepID=UPI000C2C627C|nr:LysR substrate-binding domain-containing protein [Vibrio sp. HA2012]PJC85930.1 LysR family transcriptional regulator [Vibrio sp. HA2012]